MDFVDSNIFLRYLTADDSARAEQCRAFFEKRAEEDEATLVTSVAVIMEIVWVLSSFYQYSKAEVQDIVAPIIDMPAVYVPESRRLKEALSLHAEYNIDFIDAYNYCAAKKEECETIYSYDADFDRLLDIERKEP